MGSGLEFLCGWELAPNSHSEWFNPFSHKEFLCFSTSWEKGLKPLHISPGQGAANQDPAQGILLPSHCHWRADIQVAEGVEAGDLSPGGLTGHVAKIRALGKRGTVTGAPGMGDFVGRRRGWHHKNTPGSF